MPSFVPKRQLKALARFLISFSCRTLIFAIFAEPRRSGLPVGAGGRRRRVRLHHRPRLHRRLRGRGSLRSFREVSCRFVRISTEFFRLGSDGGGYSLPLLLRRRGEERRRQQAVLHEQGSHGLWTNSHLRFNIFCISICDFLSRISRFRNSWRTARKRWKRWKRERGAKELESPLAAFFSFLPLPLPGQFLRFSYFRRS